MYRDLTRGSILRSLLLFALPMLAGDILQQLYNIADTLIVSHAIGRDALAAVGSAYTLMIFLTSILLGLSMGAGALFSIYQGRGDQPALRAGIAHALVLILSVTLVINAAVYAFLPQILAFLRVPAEVWDGMRTYLLIIFAGLLATSIYNYLSCLLRALGNSTVPLLFLAVSALLNVALDLLFVLGLHWGIAGAAWATVIAQYISAAGLSLYVLAKCKEWLPKRTDFRYNRGVMREILSLSWLTCAQQSVMNFGILLIQRLVDSFGPITMAAFAAAVKIDTFAYLPVQDFGNAYSTFVAQNFGAGDSARIRAGTQWAFLISTAFSLAISALVCVFAAPLMRIKLRAGERLLLQIANAVDGKRHRQHRDTKGLRHFGGDAGVAVSCDSNVFHHHCASVYDNQHILAQMCVRLQAIAVSIFVDNSKRYHTIPRIKKAQTAVAVECRKNSINTKIIKLFKIERHL